MRTEMKALRDKEAERASDVPALMKERDECRCVRRHLPACMARLCVCVTL